MRSETITMSLREVDRMPTVPAACNGRIRQMSAAELFGDFGPTLAAAQPSSDSTECPQP